MTDGMDGWVACDGRDGMHWMDRVEGWDAWGALDG